MSETLVGAWSLEAFEMRVDDGSVLHPMGPEPGGSLIYTATGEVSALVYRKDRPPIAAGDPMKATPEESGANFRGFVAYHGRFTDQLSDGRVIHHIERCLIPNWEGQDHVRHARIVDGRLELTTDPLAFGGQGLAVAALVWKRKGGAA